MQDSGEFLLFDLPWVSSLISGKALENYKGLSYLYEFKGIAVIPEIKNPSNGMETICETNINGHFIDINN